MGHERTLLSHQSSSLLSRRVIRHHIGLRRVLLPALIARLYLLSCWAKPSPSATRSQTRVELDVGPSPSDENSPPSRDLQEAELTLPSLGFTDIGYLRANDPRVPMKVAVSLASRFWLNRGRLHSHESGTALSPLDRVLFNPRRWRHATQ